MAKLDCKLIPNYKKGKDDVKLPSSIWEATSFGEIAEAIIRAFPKFDTGAFSLSTETSSDPTNLKQSIEDFIGDLKDQMTSKPHSKLDLSRDGDGMKQIVNSLELYYLAEVAPENEEEEPLEVIANMEKKEEERVREKLNSALNRFFKNNIPARESFKKQVKMEIAVRAIVDLNSDDGIIATVELLNSNMEKLLNIKYSTIVKYLKTLNTGEKYPTSLIDEDHQVREDALAVILKFYDLLITKNNHDVLQSEVEQGWRLQSKGVSNPFLEALHSYLIINYLDDLSSDSIGRYIGRDKDMDYPITKDDKGIHYKYRFGVDRSNRVNSWGVDARDVLREMGNFTKFLIEMIPLVNPETGEKTGEQVTPVQFMNAFTLAFANIHKIRTPKIRQALISFSDNPVEKLRTILETIHTAINLHYASLKSGSGESELYTQLIGGSGSDGAINVFDLKVLDSAYRTLFLGKRSLYNIEQRYNERYGITSRYPLVETLASEIQSSTAMYYLITRWDRNTGSYITEPKERFAEGNKFHNLRIAINKSNQINDFDSGKYKIVSKDFLDDKEIYEIKAGESTIKVIVNTTVKENNGNKVIGNIYGIFTKREKYNEIESQIDASKRTVDILVKGKDGNWKNFADLNRSINLSDYNSRALILQNRTGDNKLFLDVLDFIQLFTLLKFGADNLALATYDIFRSQRYGLFYDVLVAATRGIVIADINKKFREFRADNPGRYSASQLYKFILDNKLTPDNITSLSSGTSDYRTIWESTARGTNLLTFYSTEEWLKYYTKTLDIMSGEISKANIKNASGDSLPNYGLMYEGANPYKVINDSLHKSRVVKLNDLGKKVEMEEFRAISENIFAKDQDLIVATSNDMEVTLKDGTSKSVKMMTDSELYYHAIYDKFIINMARDRTAWIQPTTYSDKVKYVIHLVRTTVDGVDLLTAPLYKVYNLFVNSLGYLYRYLLLDILNDYAKIFNIEPIKFDINLELNANDRVYVIKYILKIEGLLRKETEKSLNAKVKVYNDLNPNDRIELTLDSHFRILPTEYNGEHIETLAFNESLVNYVLDVYTSKGISRRLRTEKFYFMQDLMKGRFGIHHLPTEIKEAGNHTVYKRILSSHPVGKLLDALAANDGLWVSKTGSLILAKNGTEAVTNINDLKESSTINPILERFFLIHSLLGNNLRMLHSGSELNHRNKELERYNWTNKIGGMLKIENASKLSVIKKFNPSLYNAIIQAAKIYNINAKQAERFWNTLSAENVRTIISFLPPDENLPYIELLEQMLYETEATSLGAQLKRNVSIPATMRPYTPSMRGIAKVMNLAIMKDIRALIYNINGDVDEEDAHDGAALINGVTSIHENWSLSENEVGSIKKPIWHSFNNKHATAGLVKFAAHTLTNNLIRNSLSAVDLIKIDKKINGWNWELIEELTTGKDLDSLNLLSIASHNTFGNTTFKDLVGGNATEVFYEGTEGNYWAITDFDYVVDTDNEGNAIPGSYGTYTTTEYLSTINGTLTGNAITVYHYFDINNEHVKSNHLLTKKELAARGLHRAHSIYELKLMFGGAYSMEKTNKKLEYSETSNYIAANFINNVTIDTDTTISEREKYNLAYDAYEKKYEEYLKKKLNGDVKVTPPEKPLLKIAFDLDHFKLPLKTYKIDYVCNNSAIKNGAANRNESERFYNDEAIDYITMSTEYYGIQMDADHDADEAELTEFSQVISALDAGGRLHSYVTSIYKALGNIAIQESKVEFNALKNYYLKLANISDDDPDKEQKLKIARDKVYTVIGNTILANLSLGSSRSGLTDAIVRNIKKEFNASGSHLNDDELKLPFSDSNLYSQVLSTFASLITKKSIRKQYPGIGAVISPAYDMLMVYDLDGEVVKYDDVLKLAKLLYKRWLLDKDKENNPYNTYFNAIVATDDTSKWNKSLVDAYLKKKEDDLNRNASYALPLTAEPEDWSEILLWFDPLQKVEIYYTGDNGVVGTELVDLSDIRTYYEFMANPVNYLRRKLNDASIKVSSFKRVITKGRNLAPSMLSWKYKDGDILKRKNIYSSAILIKQFLNSIDKTPSKISGVASAYEDAVAFYNRELAKDGKYEKVLDLLDDLANNTWNGFNVEVESKEAELIMSNIYQTKFGIDHHVSLAEVLKNPKEYFSDKPKPLIFGGADSTFYDLVMMKANGRHAYISFDSAFTVEDSDDKYYTTYWKDRSLHRETFVDRRSPEEILASPNKVVNEVYVMDEDNHPLFRVGRDILRTDLSYNAENEYFYITKTLEIVSSKNLQEVNGQVIEYVEFVTLNIYRKGKNRFKVYNIDSERLRYASNMAKEDSEEAKKLNDTVIYNLMQLIVKSLYQSDSYEVLTLNNNRVKVNNVHILKRILPGLAGDFSYDLKLSEYISNLNNFINKSLPLIYVNEFTSRVILKQGTITKERNGKKVELSANRLGYAVDETTGDILLPAKSAAKGILRKQINDYYQDLAKRKLASFEMSRYFTASRIPAQTLLSFMAMKLVAFTGEPGALAYVSHWLTWLQGSDYDIDKAYIMGLAFNDNSSYIGWSTLFDYFDAKTLRESLNLLMGDPKATYTIEDKNPDSIDVTEEIETIRRVDIRTKLHRDDTTSKEFKPYLNDFEESNDRVERVKAYVKILNLLENGSRISSSNSYKKEVMKALRKHNEIDLPPQDYSLALRNFISSHILGTVLNVRNLKDSYVPVEMKDLRKPAAKSAKGQESKRITLLNPLSIYKMLRQNMIGKNVIAIAATGQKAAFMWNYYLNDVYTNAKEGVDYELMRNPETGEAMLDPNGNPIINIKKNSDLQFVQFSFISKILGPLNKVDSEGNKYTEVRTLPDVNFEKAMESIRNYALTHKLNPKRPVDIMISEMISAATDNAKELILAKINAGNNLAKCHLFLITLGFDIDQIIEFMTSDVVDWIDRISGLNIFLGLNKTVGTAASLIEDYLNYLLALLKQTKPKKELKKGDLRLVQQVVPNNLTEEQIKNYLLYINEFNNILDGANEFSNFGNLLKVNQGIPGKAEDLLARLDTIKEMFDARDNKKLSLTEYERFKYFPLMHGEFDPVKWLQDTEIKVIVPKVDENENVITNEKTGEAIMEELNFSYRLLTSEYYDKNKKTLNIFAAANHLPHFRNMFALMGSEYTVYNFSVKSKLLQKIVKDTREEIPGMFIDSRFYSKALQGANDLLIIKYFKDKDFMFPVKARTELIKYANGSMGRMGTKGNILDLSTNVGRAAFKQYFETYIIPSLLSGTCPFLTEEQNAEVSRNEFIRALIPSIDDHKDIWKLDLDMSSESTYTITLLNSYSKALLQLDYIKINNISLSDWFLIYNLIINKNRYGSDRLTKAFEYFINNYDTKFKSVINDFLEYIGDLDKEDTNIEKEFSFNIVDMFILLAKLVTELGGLTDPVVIMQDENNNFIYYIKKSKDSYMQFKRAVIPTIVGEFPDDRLERFERIRNYFVLNNVHSDMVTSTLEDLKKSPVETLMRLYQDGTLNIHIHCE